MPLNNFLRKYMFPEHKTKTIRNILEILVVDWKYTGTLNSDFAILSWQDIWPPSAWSLPWIISCAFLRV